MVVCLGGFLAFMAGGIWLILAGDDGRRSIAIGTLCLIEFGVFTVVTLRVLHLSRDRIAVDQSGIWYVPQHAPVTFIAWDQVARVSAHDTLRRLVLSDVTGTKGIRLEYQLRDFDQLRQFVLAHASNRESLRGNNRQFGHGALNLGIDVFALVLCVAFAIESPRSGELQAPLYFIGFGLLSIVELAMEPRRLTISGRTFSIDYFGRQRTYSFDAVTAIELKNVADRHGNSRPGVLVGIRNAQPLKLSGYRAGSVALYDALRSAWMSARGITIAPPPTAPALSFNPSAPGVPEPSQPETKARPLYLRFIGHVAFVIALMAILSAPRIMMWARWRFRNVPPPDLNALASFPVVPTGWAGKPQPLFPDAPAMHRWSLDYRTGALTHSQTDLYIGDSIPINVSHTYANMYRSAAFGDAMSISYDMFLTGDANRFTYLDLNMPDGAKYHFGRILPGTSWSGSVFKCDANGPDDDVFAGLRLWWSGGGWTLRVTRGMVFKFPSVDGTIRPGQGAVTSIADAEGKVLTIERDSMGNVLRIISPHSACVNFDHDKHNRLTRARDNYGNTVSYSYDDSGRLDAVNDSRYGVTRYSYDPGNNLVAITHPDGKEWLRAEYDNHARVVKLTFADKSSFRYAYETDEHDLIKAVNIFPAIGPSSRVTFNTL